LYLTPVPYQRSLLLRGWRIAVANPGSRRGRGCPARGAGVVRPCCCMAPAGGGKEMALTDGGTVDRNTLHRARPRMRASGDGQLGPLGAAHTNGLCSIYLDMARELYPAIRASIHASQPNSPGASDPRLSRLAILSPAGLSLRRILLFPTHVLFKLRLQSRRQELRELSPCDVVDERAASNGSAQQIALAAHA